MNTNMLALATSLSDHDLLARVGVLAAREREAIAELVAHLAALDAWPSLFAAESHGSLFSYCTRVLRLSEDATCTRIQAARVSRRFPRILDLLSKFAATPRPRRAKPIRREADESTTPAPSRDIPNHVQRGAWARDAGRCGYVSKNGQRCTERTFLEFHHVVPYALGGLATLDNISLRCRRHNQYESELVFGPRGFSEAREHGPWPAAWRETSRPVSPRSG